MVRPVIALSLWMMMSGCTYNFVMIDRTEKKSKYVEVSNNFYFWGWVGKGSVDIYKLCGTEHVYKVADRQSFFQLLITGVTLGIAQPRTVAITCSSANSSKQMADL